MTECELACSEQAVGRSEPTKYDDGSGDTAQQLCRRHLLMAQQRHLLQVNGGTMLTDAWYAQIEQQLAKP